MKFWQLILAIILITIVCAVLVLAIYSFFIMDTDTAKESSTSDEPRICPTCGTPLVKGVYGQYFPQFVWYCPNCP